MQAQPPAPRRPSDTPDGELSPDGAARWTLSAIAPRCDQVGYVRLQTRLVLDLWRIADLTPPVEVLISELATNVVRHARTLFTVTVAWDGLNLRVEVSDANPLAPRPQLAFDAGSEGGRGLFLVDAVATAWGVDFYHQGKTIWFTISRDLDQSWSVGP